MSTVAGRQFAAQKIPTVQGSVAEILSDFHRSHHSGEERRLLIEVYQAPDGTVNQIRKEVAVIDRRKFEFAN